MQKVSSLTVMRVDIPYGDVCKASVPTTGLELLFNGLSGSCTFCLSGLMYFVDLEVYLDTKSDKSHSVTMSPLTTAICVPV